MLVLIPNPNQIAELVKIQKDFIEKVNICGNQSAPSRPIFYQNTPLWIFLPEEKFSLSGNEKTIKNELKELSQRIKKVELEEPGLYFSEKLQQMVLGAAAYISTDSGLCKAELIICKTASVVMETASVVMKTTTSESDSHLLNICFANVAGKTEGVVSDLTFPLQLKIFRLAAAEELSPGTYAVNESVWRKINRAQ